MTDFNNPRTVFVIRLWPRKRRGYDLNTDKIVDGRWRFYIRAMWHSEPRVYALYFASGWELIG